MWPPGFGSDGDGRWRQSLTAQFPDRDEMMTIGIADGADGRRSASPISSVVAGQPGERRGDRKVQVVAFGCQRVDAAFVARSGERRQVGRADARREAAAGRTADARLGHPAPSRSGRGEESLQVAQPVAPIPARVDPEVAQPARRHSRFGSCWGARPAAWRPWSPTGWRLQGGEERWSASPMEDM